MSLAVEVKDLYKRYGNFEAVSGISFTVEEGSFFAFLGPNGAGKSTSINIISGALPKTSGEVRVCGYDIERQRGDAVKSIGIVFQSTVLDASLTVKENLMSRAALYGMSASSIREAVEELTEMFELEQILGRRYGKLSGGQKRRADIARAVVNHPKLLFLDEPTTGLDPQTRKKVWDTISRLRKNGMTIFLTTHYMEESEDADIVAIIDGGKIAAMDTVGTLKEKYSYDAAKLYSQRQEPIKTYLEKNRIEYKVKSDMIECKLVSGKDFIPHLENLKEMVDGFEILKGNMDTVFLNVTGKNLREA